MKCNSSRPYPSIRVNGKNEDYARLLMEDYAGGSSEETAIHLYLYQSLILKDKNEELADILKEISKVEMKHLDILGTLIEKLGVSPAFGAFDGDFLLPWNSSTVNYTTDLKDILLIDIDREQSAIKKYREHIRTIEDENIKQILARIIEDEMVHLDIFYYFLKKSSCNEF